VNANRFGLARNINAATKRAVRQACGFGCVICGNPFIQYHHAGVAFSDAREHDPKKITLLCGGCHDRVSRGTLSDEAVMEGMNKPYCLDHGPLGVELDYGKVAPKVRFAGTDFDDCTYPIRVADYAVLALAKPDEADAPVEISALFTNSRGEISLVISSNEVCLMPTNWDATAEGQSFRIWDAARQPSLTMTYIPRQHLVIDRIESTLLEWRFSGNQDELRFWAPGQKRANVIAGGMMQSAHVGYQFGTPRLGKTIVH